MGAQGSRAGYCPPAIADYGDLTQVTASIHLLLGQAGAPDLSFSSPTTTPGPGGGGGPTFTEPNAGGDPGGGQDIDPGGDGDPGVEQPRGEGGDVGGEGDSGGSGSGGGGSGGGSAGGGSGGGELPFTGFEAGLAAGIGALLAGAGTKLRRVVRRGPEHPGA
jgi:hypothetical protein